ncbi:MAG: hypothetical protein LAO76_02175 [Acidobacteriia bacterium]|jgi:hypothetical protein|nr:hypothetical protein [Terriglobia bacterium]
MPDPPITRRVFVDFMYAIVVAAVLPLINGNHLQWDPVFYSVGFLILVILEDYFLYETQIARFQRPGSLSFLGLILEIGILICWYLAAISIPDHPRWFLSTLSLFFVLKFLAGLAHWRALRWESMRNLAFFLPVATCGWIARCHAPVSIDGATILKLTCSWLVMVAIWWSITKLNEPTTAAAA